jgi:pseudouridine kinase
LFLSTCPEPTYFVNDTSKKNQLYELIRANPFISQQDLAVQLRLSRSAVAGHVASLMRERRLLGRAYVLPDRRPVMCLGAANLDRKLRTLAALQMGTSNPASAEEVYGGVARNIAENLARLGAPVALLTVLGDDAAGRSLSNHAEEAGIDTRGSLRLANTCSGTYTAVLDDRGEMILALADMQLYEALTPEFLDSRAPQRAAAALTVADLNLPREAVATLLRDARRDAVPLVIVAVSQPKMVRLPEDLHGLRLLILNRGELETRIGRALPRGVDIGAACAEVLAQGAQQIIVTCGHHGVYYTSATAADGVAHLPAHDVQTVDVTGAGDAFAAAVCWSLHQGSDDLKLACRRGLKLAAMTLECDATVSPLLAADILDEIHDFDMTLPAHPAQPTLFDQD